MTTYLDNIVAHHRARVAADPRDLSVREPVRYTGPSLASALDGYYVRVIGEIKRASPSRGPLAPDVDPVHLARSYIAGGAAAISVLTDAHFFAGSLDDLRLIATTSLVPVLRKDFILSPHDVLDAVEAGAGAILLIVAALDDRELTDLLALATSCGLSTLVEVHDEPDIRRLSGLDVRIVGVNQRDLCTFEIDPTRAARLHELLPTGLITVAESGLRSVADVTAVANAGFDAVLVGEAFVSAPDPREALAAFAAVPRVRR